MEILQFSLNWGKSSSSVNFVATCCTCAIPIPSSKTALSADKALDFFWELRYFKPLK